MLKNEQKHSVMIAGHKTSIALENDFFAELRKISAKRKISLNNLITEIDRNKNKNLSSELRLFVLHDLQNRINKYENNS